MKLQHAWLKIALLAVVAVMAGTIAYFATAPPEGPRTLRAFNPERVADLELRMWQAYYAKQNVRLFGLLVITLREQYHYSWTTAAREAYRLARAASTFGDATGNYEAVLPDLEAAYTTAKDWLHAGFDPHEVARAELAWWVARRTPGQNAVAVVAGFMADEYALLYEAPYNLVDDAALLRAQAAALRDEEAAEPDWKMIGDLLRQSYRMLLEKLTEVNAGGRYDRDTFVVTRRWCSLPSGSRT